MIPTRLPEPFSDPDWIFEVRHDGFRALCYLNAQSVKLAERRGLICMLRVRSSMGRSSALIRTDTGASSR
jgi:hypothetical protein